VRLLAVAARVLDSNGLIVLVEDHDLIESPTLIKLIEGIF
jgi:hypothetical protein